jgi:sulfate adenylyltransferase subunit 2
MDHLRLLESESIHILREAVGERDRPILLFSAGKDSIVLFHLARKAFYPARVPFPLLHVDTGHNFEETLEFRDELVREHRAELIVASVQEDLDAGRISELKGPGASRNRLQTFSLLRALSEYRCDVAFGGARRDEERARAKERILSHRDRFGQWAPKNQRPELWNLYNTRLTQGEHFRVFPLSNWTELDIWQYIMLEGIRLPSLYFAHRRSVFARDGMLYADSPVVERLPSESTFEEVVRFRTIGDLTCTGAVRSSASNILEVIAEILEAKVTERGATRADDQAEDGAMEQRKLEGYF